MKDLLNSDKYTSIKTSNMTGAVGRQWLEYADGIFEPVRKDGNLNKKYHDNKRSLDWWVVDKPTDWNPLTEGKKGFFES
nr:hypothetical protein [Pseudodesulfovibrio sp.]